MRIVLDTNILVRANPLASPQGLARELLLRIVSGPHLLILSPPILEEVRRVLAYPHVQSRWKLTAESIALYLAFLEKSSFCATLPDRIPSIVSDPDDDPIIQTAVLGRADALCTRDAAFRHAAVQRFCDSHRVRVLDDIALLAELRRREH